MDCSAGSALAQQFAKDALHIHGGVGVGAGGNPNQDAIMGDMMMSHPAEAVGNWVQQFSAQHHHHHHHHYHHHHHHQHQQQMMMRQQNEAMMLRHHQQQQQQQQQRDMESAFPASSAGPQHAGAMMGPCVMPPHMMMAPMLAPAVHSHFMMGPPPPMMMMPRLPVTNNQTAMQNSITATEATISASATTEAAAAETTTTTSAKPEHQGDSAWADTLRNTEWAQDYSDAQVFTLGGESAQTLEEHAQNSAFYQFMDKIRNKELLVDEETGQVVQGPGPDPDVPEDREYLREWASAEGLNIPPGVFENVPQTYGGHPFDTLQRESQGLHDERMLDGSDDAFDHSAEVEDWAREYAEMQEREQAAQNNTDYPFEPNNPYLSHGNAMEEGLAMLNLGNFAEAAMAFEAVCQREPEREEAWRLLGTTQAGNEKDGLAIIALNHARMLDPKDTAVHAALAVSHTNEHNVKAALQSLRAWLLSHPEYEHLGSVNLQEVEGGNGELDVTDDDFFFASPSEYRSCRTLLNAALEMNPNDSQLHANLGVLHNLSHRFDEAAANFRRAIELRPGDAVLWNKLGATLANGNKPQEALDAYNHALDINPGYVRVMYNMAVAYSNMSQYPVAAKQVTRAIAMQTGGAQPQSDIARQTTRGMWDLLRMLLNLMDRADLVELSWQYELTPFLKEFGLEEMIL